MSEFQSKNENSQKVNEAEFDGIQSRNENSQKVNEAEFDSIQSRNERSDKLKAILECALLIAVGTVLAQIKIFRMPSGGSVTAASMVPFLLISYRHGTKWGLLAGFANALLQMALGGIYPPVAPGPLAYFAEILLDYILAYMVLGFEYLFYQLFIKAIGSKPALDIASKPALNIISKPALNIISKPAFSVASKSIWAVGLSTLICCLLRFTCAAVSGFLVWADITSSGIAAVTYSLAYNASYLVPESIITIIVMCLLYKANPQFFKRQTK